MPKELLEKQEIKEKLIEIGKQNGFTVTNNIDKIVNAKYRFFGINEFRRCPCDSSNEERYCCSQLCQTDVRAKKTCHCRLFEKGEK